MAGKDGPGIRKIIHRGKGSSAEGTGGLGGQADAKSAVFQKKTGRIYDIPWKFNIGPLKKKMPKTDQKKRKVEFPTFIFQGAKCGNVLALQELKSREAARQRRRLDLEDGEGVLAEEPLKTQRHHHSTKGRVVSQMVNGCETFWIKTHTFGIDKSNWLIYGIDCLAV